ncbi:hypothetical protein [Streptomyces sp. JW3]|uniref:hypothetical protein n=1 Tax=Streptomyces sp. JW3 TaxID=3456955 RepID=UPI003FA4812C
MTRWPTALLIVLGVLGGLGGAGCGASPGAAAARDAGSAPQSSGAVAYGGTSAIPPPATTPDASATAVPPLPSNPARARPRTPAATAATATPARRGPDLSRTPTPSPSPARSGDPTPAAGPAPRAGRAVLRIGDWTSYVRRGGQAEVDACRDAVRWTGPEIGREDGYEMQTVVIVGHDYCNGFDRFARLPVGTRVTLTTVHGRWTYQVYANYLTPGRGVPAAGLYWGDLTLQSCVGPDTGFSYLVRL